MKVIDTPITLTLTSQAAAAAEVAIGPGPGSRVENKAGQTYTTAAGDNAHRYVTVGPEAAIKTTSSAAAHSVSYLHPKMLAAVFESSGSLKGMWEVLQERPLNEGEAESFIFLIREQLTNVPESARLQVATQVADTLMDLAHSSRMFTICMLECAS